MSDSYLSLSLRPRDEAQHPEIFIQYNINWASKKKTKIDNNHLDVSV